jgi:hypothetical protein
VPAPVTFIEGALQVTSGPMPGSSGGQLSTATMYVGNSSSGALLIERGGQVLTGTA